MADRGRLRLGVSVDHVAALRKARGMGWPDPLRAALLAEASGADGITAHLREDRLHLDDSDIEALAAGIGIPLNCQCAATPAMQAFLLRLKPQTCCLLPPGPDFTGLTSAEPALRPLIAPLRDAGIRVAVLARPLRSEIEAAARSGASIVELNCSEYSELHASCDQQEAALALRALTEAASLAVSLGLEVQAGHGLTYENVEAIAAVPGLSELHVGHFLIGEAVYIGLGPAIEEMRRRMDAACQW